MTVLFTVAGADVILATMGGESGCFLKAYNTSLYSHLISRSLVHVIISFYSISIEN